MPTCGSRWSGGITQLQRFPSRSEGFQPCTGLPSLRHQCLEKEPPQHQAVKISGDSVSPGKMKGCRKARHPLKGSTETHLFMVTTWALMEEQWLGRCQRHMGRNWVVWLQVKGWRNRRHCPSSGTTHGEHHLSCFEPHLPLQGQVWICISLMNFIVSILMTLWDLILPNFCTSRSNFYSKELPESVIQYFFKKFSKVCKPQADSCWLPCALCLLLNETRFGTCTKFEPVLTW